ncbi:hypothetical protein BGZ94_009727, partial [Podila epigama]
DKKRYFKKVFKDPPDAAALINRVLPSGQPPSDRAVDDVQGRNSSTFRLLQFNNNCPNTENIFRAAYYLRDALWKRARLEDEHFVFARSHDSVEFKSMAAELGTIEPTLQGVSSQALHSLHERLVKERNALDAFEMTMTGDKWKGTELATIAVDIAYTDKMIREREARQKAPRNEEAARMAAEALTRSHTAMQMAMGKRNAHDALLDTDGTQDEQQSDEEADDSGSESEDTSVQRPPDISFSRSPALPTDGASDQSSSSTPIIQPQSPGATTWTTLPSERLVDSSDSSDSSMASRPSVPRFLTLRTKRRAVSMIPAASLEQVEELENRLTAMESRITKLIEDHEVTKRQIARIQKGLVFANSRLDDSQIALHKELKYLRDEINCRLDILNMK